MDSNRTVNDDSDPTRDLRIDVISRRFEQLRQAGNEPRIEAFVAQAPESIRREVLRNLLRLELQEHEDPTLLADSYLNRFPAEQELIRAVFGELSRTTGDETATPLERVGERPARTIFDQHSDAPTRLDAQEDRVVLPEAPSRTYKVRREVAAGGMGVILEVWDENLKRPLAMKVIRHDDVRNSYFTPIRSHLMRRFLREAEITAQLEHPGVVPVHDVGLDDHGKLYFTMRLIKGKSLHEVFLEVEREGSDWTPARVLDVLVNVCQTMAYAHSQGIIHRDLKPANVMVGEFGETYVMDWGLAKSLHAEDAAGDSLTSESQGPSSLEKNPFLSSLSDRDDATVDGSVLGTPAYMPPEQALGQIDQIDARSDVYAVGTMLYQLLTRSAPYMDEISRGRKYEVLEAVQQRSPTPIGRLNARVSPELVAICEKAMARDKSERYADLREMAADLQAFMEHRVVRAYRTGPWIELKKWIGRNRGLAVASIAAVLLAVSGLLGVIGVQVKAKADLNVAFKNEQRQRQIADEQRRDADRQRRAANRARNTADQERNAADLARRRVEALYLTRESNGVREEDPALAMLLAREAAEREPSAATHQALLSSLLELREERAFVGHQGDVLACAFHPQGTLVATASSDNTAAIWEIQSGRRLAWLVGHDDRVTDICFSPDGGTVATACFDGSIKLWDSPTGATRLTLSGHLDRVRRVAFSPTGDTLYSCSMDTTARAWDPRSGRSSAVLSGHLGPVTQLAVSPDGSRVATGSTDGTVRLWTGNGEFIAVLEGHAGGISALVFSDDGNWLATAAGHPFDYLKGERAKGMSKDATARIWHAADGRPSHVLRGSEQRVNAVCFSQSGDRVLTAGADRIVRLWKLSNGELERSFDELQDEVASLASVGSQVMVSVGGDSVFLMNLETGSMMSRLRGHKEKVLACAFSPRGNRVLTASKDSTAKLWNVAGRRWGHVALHDPHPKVRLNHTAGLMLIHADDISDVLIYRFPATEILATVRLEASCVWADLTPDGNKLATISQAGQLQLWSASDGNWLADLGSAGNGTDALFSRDGLRLLVRSPTDHTLTEWDLIGSKIIHRVETPGARPEPPCDDWSRFIAREISDQSVQVWDRSRDVRLFKLPASPDVPLVALNVDGRRLLSRLHQDSRAELLRADTGEHVAWLEHNDRIASAVFSNDGQRIATTSRGGTAKLWEATSGKLLRQLSLTSGQPVFAQFGPQRRRLVTWSSDNKVGLWNTATGHQIGDDFSDASGPLRATPFSPDGKYILVWSAAAEYFTLLETSTARQMGVFKATDTGTIETVEYGQDGGWVVTAGGEKNDQGEIVGGYVQVWPVDLQAFAERRSPRTLSATERNLYSVGTPDERAKEIRRLELQSSLRSLSDLAACVRQGDPLGYPVKKQVREVVIRILGAEPLADEAEAAIIGILGITDQPAYEDAETLVDLASVYARSNNLRDATIALEQALHCPNPPSTIDGRLIELRRRMWPDLASYASIDALFDNPRHPPDSSTLDEFQQAVVNADDTRVLYFTGRLNQREKQYQTAIEAYKAVLELDPDYPEPYLRLVECLRAAGNPSDAEVVLRGALELPVRQAADLWSAWAVLNFMDLHQDGGQLLSAWPRASGDILAPTVRARCDDLKWLCERLAANEIVRINCGGEAYTARDESIWSADRFHLGGWGYLGSEGAPQVSTKPIDGTEDDPLYQTERWFRGDAGVVLGYQVPLPPGQYRVMLYFAEIYHNSPGNRVFDLLVEGERMLSDFDPSVKGITTAHQHQLPEVFVSDGLLEIQFDPKQGDPNISAISIERID